MEVTVSEIELDDEQFLAEHPVGSYVHFEYWDGPEHREVLRHTEGEVVAHPTRTGRSWSAEYGTWTVWYPDTSFLVVSEDGGKSFVTVTSDHIYEP